MIEQIVMLAGATLAALGSPGPATLALAAAGASFGPGRSARFLFGILAGLLVVALLSAVGIAAFLARGEWIASTLLALSFCYFAYIAYKVAAAPLVDRAAIEEYEPPSLRDGFIVNLTNPKAYAAFAALYTGFGLPIEPVWLSVCISGALILIIATIIDVAWLLLGSVLAPAFASQRYGRILRVALAILMLLAVATSILFAARGN